jgi:hypothetical protein
MGVLNWTPDTFNLQQVVPRHLKINQLRNFMKKQPTLQDQAQQYNDFCKYVLLDTSLGQCTKSFNYLSTREIQDKYGLACAKIFRLMFVLYQKGGRNLKGKAYKTLWVQHKKNSQIFKQLHHAHIDMLVTGKQILQLMVEQGCQAEERVKVWNEDFTWYDAEIFGGEELKEAKIEKRNRADRERYREMKQIRESLWDIKGVH